MSLRRLIDAAPIRPLQIQILILCTVIAAVEGVDIISMSIVSVDLKPAWGLTGTQVGALLSVGPAGMIAGAVLLAPLADRVGRRPVMLVAMAIVAAGMLLSAVAPSYAFLLVIRALTGIGMGAVIPINAILVSEYFPTRRRASAIGIITIGNPIGAAIIAAVASPLMGSLGWHSIFWIGGLSTAIVLVSAWFLLPETPDFVEARGTAKDQAAAMTLMRRLRLDEVREAAAADSTNTDSEPAGKHSTAGFGVRSLAMVLFSVIFIAVNGAYYLANLWLPQLLLMAGLPESTSLHAVSLFSLGAVVGSLLFAAATLRWSPFTMCCLLLAGGIVAFLGIAGVAGSATPALVAAFVLGMCMLAALGGLFALAPLLFQTGSRASALGLAGGFGRVGTTLAPMGIGLLVDSGWGPDSLFMIAVIPTAVALILIAVLGRMRRRRLQSVPVAESAMAQVQSA